jgi:hypothetical protein
MEDSTNPYKVLVRKSEEKMPLRKSRCRSEDNIKTDIKEIGYEGGALIHLAHDRNW